LWKYFEWKLANVSSIEVKANNMDEVRLYPAGAQMITYTYDPLIGMTSQCDVNSRVTNYEYDAFGRLQYIRDENRNILKKYCYNYQGQQQTCGVDLTPLWQSTGVTRCKPCPTNSVYTSNIRQHQEKDNNPTSLSYNTVRWIDDGVNASCVPSADWQQINLYCELNVSGQNTGNQVRVEKDMNPCSLTYNTGRNTIIANCATCSKPQVWQSTGNYRCVISGGVNTGDQEREERNVETCSLGYNTTRWTSNGTNCVTCPKPSNWQATGSYRCVKDASNQNAGYQEREEKDISTCSPTYNTFRWVSIGYNTTACPLPYVCSTSNCTGADHKCINNVCELGIRKNLSTVRVKVDGITWKWKCTWTYCFSNGSTSGTTYDEYNDTACSISSCIVIE
jgi:YD repeat-containing protein